MNQGNINVDPQMLLHFFLHFSRFECALKSAGYGYGQGQGNYASPNWTDFASSISGTFNRSQSQDLDQACAYILVNPPNQQIWHHGNIQWQNIPPPNANTEPEALIGYVKRIRNNLFHGGKHNGNPDRTKRLIRGAILILDECLRVSHQVRVAYRACNI